MINRERVLRAYLRDIKGLKQLEPEEEKRLIIKFQKTGDMEARNRLVESLLWFVFFIAKHYSDDDVQLMLDLINAGNIGLIKAIEKFNLRRKNRLATYAKWWVLYEIFKALRVETRSVILPTYVVERYYLIARVAKKLSLKLGREPTLEEIARESGLSLIRVGEIMQAWQRELSLDHPLSPYEDEASATLIDLIPDTLTEPTDRDLNQDRLSMALLKHVARLPPQERTVIEMHFGLDGQRQHTLEEIGQEFDVSREWIRQIKEKALAKLRRWCPDLRYSSNENCLTP